MSALPLLAFLSACVTAPTVGLPLPDADFPKKWTILGRHECTPREGETLRSTLYTQEANDDLMRIIITAEKNGVRVIQVTALRGERGYIGVRTEFLVDGKVVAIDARDDNAVERGRAATLAATGFTKDEYQACLKKR